MLRLPRFRIATPSSVGEAIALLAEAGPSATIVAGGTDLVPNMKHEIATPSLVVSLARIRELRGVRVDVASGWTSIGALTTLEEVAAHEHLLARAPALAQAASLVAGPQLRTMGTLGGNVMLDTRCQWINQTYFWRQALGFCLKKDGTKCHVVEGGSKCVAAASNDTAPALMTLRAELVFEGPAGRRVLPIDDLWIADGIDNKKREHGEILVEVRVPPQAERHRGAYGKLRERGSIDFPMLGVAARVDLDASGAVEDADLVLTALQARPLRVKKIAELLRGTKLDGAAGDDALRACAEQAYKQAHPLPNIPGDHAWRREMVPVYVRRTLAAAIRGDGPVHHV